MSLPPVIERLKQNAPQSELGNWVRRNLFDWHLAKTEPNPDWVRRYLFIWRLTQTEPRLAAFRELFTRFGTHLEESSVRVAETPEDDPYWESAPKSQAFGPVLIHYLQTELRQTPHDERVLWSLAGLAVEAGDNDFGRLYLVPLCVKNTGNVRWLVESAIWVLNSTGYVTTKGLRESLEELGRLVPDFQTIIQRFTTGTDKELARAAEVSLWVAQGGSIMRFLGEFGLG